MTWKFAPIGVRLLGPAPIRDVWVPLNEGVHAYYGLNGAGKTRLLNAIADCYEGRGTGYVVGRAVESEEASVGYVDGLLDGIEGPSRLRHGLDEVSAEAVAQRPWLGRSRIERVVGERLWTELEAGAETSDPEVRVRQVDEAVRQRLFALTPSEDGQRWNVAAAARIDGSSPALMAEAQELLGIGTRYASAALAHGARDPYPPEDHWDETWYDELKHLFWDIVGEAGIDVDDATGLLVSATPFFQAFLEGDLGGFGQMLQVLEPAAVAPLRLAGAWGMGNGLGSLPMSAVLEVRRADDRSIDDVHDLTARLIADAIDPLDMIGHDGDPSEDLLALTGSLNETATNIYRRLLADAPDLQVLVAPPGEWLTSRGISWSASDFAPHLSLSDLSEAQLRWALTAIELAVGDHYAPGQHPWIVQRQTLLVLDEPDAALHATAERYAVDGLVSLSEPLHATILCSTHSREFLNCPGVALHHVTRDITGHVAVHSGPTNLNNSMAELGLSPADLFLLHRVILLVEGHHERVIFDELFSDELAAAHVLVVPLHGGSQLSLVVEADVLARFSDAPVIAALDDLRQDVVESFWNELFTSQPSEHDAIVSRHFARGRSEDSPRFLIDFARAVYPRGRRFEIVGMSKPDIPEYLPVRAIVPEATSWEQLREDFANQTKFKNFKKWATALHDADYSDENLRRAVRSLDSVPDDFVYLLGQCQLASQRPRHRTVDC